MRTETPLTIIEEGIIEILRDCRRKKEENDKYFQKWLPEYDKPPYPDCVDCDGAKEGCISVKHLEDLRKERDIILKSSQYQSDTS